MATSKKATVRPSPAAKGRSPVPAPVVAFPSALLAAGLVIGLYAMLPAIFTGGIHLRRSVEIVDHVVPAVVVLILTVVAIVKGAKPESLMLAAGVLIVLAGFWMVATHVGLARQALNGQASRAGAAYHCSTAVAVGALGLVWVWRYRAAGDGGHPATTTGRRR